MDYLLRDSEEENNIQRMSILSKYNLLGLIKLADAVF
jgi:hypothetical protein